MCHMCLVNVSILHVQFLISLVTTCQLQCDQTLPSHVKGVACVRDSTQSLILDYSVPGGLMDPYSIEFVEIEWIVDGRDTQLRFE